VIAPWEDATAIAAAVRSGHSRATSLVEDALAGIARADGRYNAFTHVLDDQARKDAAEVDAKVAASRDPGPLAGVPFAVKNLFDVAGLTTLAGSKINRDNPPARADAAVVRALRDAGAVLVGTLNMDEYAYGFTTENTHYGPTRNPYDLARSAGGSSGGSGAAVAAGLVPISLGTDTGGSIRVPAALCGLFGLKPTFGRVSRVGTTLFSATVDHVGPLARSVRDLALVYDLLPPADAADRAHHTPTLPALRTSIAGLRVALAGGYFQECAEPEAVAAARRVAEALNARSEVTVPHAAAARAAATIITGVEGSGLHLVNLRKRPADFDPMTRDRFIAAALLPGAAYLRAQALRRIYRDAMHALFADIDVLVAPTTPTAAPLIGQDTVSINGITFPSRAHLGRFTIPFSIIGLPVLSVPVSTPGPLPRGVQLVAAPFKESLLLQAAAFLETKKMVEFTPPAESFR
jgi:AtzE family amidohydrolase